MHDSNPFDMETSESEPVSRVTRGTDRTPLAKGLIPPKPVAAPKGISQETFMRVVTACELAYRTIGGIPTLAQIQSHCSVQPNKLGAVMTSREFKTEMAMRGIAWSQNERVTKDLRPEQILVLGIITDPTNRRPMAEKLRQAGVSYATYRNWLRNPVFAERVGILGEQLLGDNIATIHTRLVERAERGDMAAIKLFYEVSGRHDPAKQQMLDLGKIIGLVLEVLTYHVSDTKTLSNISMDLEAIMSGSTPKSIGSLHTNEVYDERIEHGLDDSGDFADNRTINLADPTLSLNDPKRLIEEKARKWLESLDKDDDE